MESKTAAWAPPITMTTHDALSAIPKTCRFNVYGAAGQFLGDVFAVNAAEAVAKGQKMGVAAVWAKR